MTKIPKLKIILIACVLSFVATPVFAAELFFDAKTNEVRVGEQFEVKIFVNTPEESVNAFEGKITFPSDFVGVKEIRDGNSIINFWIDKPKVQNGAIIFSGITPGGFQGNNGLLFSAVFEAKSESVAHFEINDVKVLRNDGIGSMAGLTVTPFEIVISKRISVEIPALPKIKDIERPESFAPEIARDESIFNGEWFVVFVTQDKSSGIDHYEIKESRQRFLSVFKKWVSAESPYVLAGQELRSFVFVKAVDKAGNERIAVVEPKYPMRWYEQLLIWFIMVIIGIIVYVIWRKLKNK